MIGWRWRKNEEKMQDEYSEEVEEKVKIKADDKVG